MKSLLTLAFAVLVGCAKHTAAPVAVAVAPTAAPCPAPPPAPEVCFSPKGNCTDFLVKRIRQSTKNIYVQAFSFTSAPIATALADMSAQGVDVQIVLDSADETERGGQFKYVVGRKVPTYLDAAHAIAHNKVMILDERYVVTGSFNFTASAESRNAENLLVLDDPVLAARYIENWKKHQAHSKSK